MEQTVNGVKILTKNNIYSFNIKKALDQLYFWKNLENGNCKVCNNETSKFCSHCGVHYCSRECQMSDWSNHKAMCTQCIFSNLWITDPKSRMLQCAPSCNETETILKCSIAEPKDACVDFKKSSGMRAASHGKRRSAANGGSKNEEQLRMKERSHEITCGKSKKNIKTDADGTKMGEGGRKSFTDEANFLGCESASNDGSEDSKDVSDSDKGISALGIATALQPGDKVNVICTSWESDSACWVIEEKNKKELDHLKKLLAEECVSSRDKIPVEGMLYGCKHGAEWYRGKIIKAKDKTVFRCIDTGKIYDNDNKLVKELPRMIRSVQRLAFLVEIFGDPREAPRRKITPFRTTVEVIGMVKDGVYGVRVCKGTGAKEEESAGEKEERKESAEGKEQCKEGEKALRENEAVLWAPVRRSVVDVLEVGHTGVFLPMRIRGQMFLGSLVPEDLEDALLCSKKISRLYCMEEDVIEPQVGDVVMIAKSDNTGQRGVVTSVSSEHGYKVNLLDYGYTAQTSKVFQLPENVRNLMDLACKMTVGGEQFQCWLDRFETNMGYAFEIEKKTDEGKWLCKLNADDETVVLAEVEKVETRVPQAENCVSLQSGCRVVISHVNPDGSLYVRRVDENWEKTLEDVVLKINTTSTENDADVTIRPMPGDLVASKFESDDIYYRAKVISGNEDKVKVFFVDYGNEQMCKITDLKGLPTDVRNVPFFARKITLHRGSDTSSTVPKCGVDYLINFVANSTELIMTFDEDPGRGVFLKDKNDCFHINDYICNLTLNSEPETPSEDSDEFTKKFSKPSTLPPGPVEGFLVLYVDEAEFMSNGLFWAASLADDNFTYVMKEMVSDVSAYCSSSGSDYVPQVNELCLAQFEGCWCRALVLESNGHQSQVFFLDYGNKSNVDFNLTRKMLPKFFEAPPLAAKCIFNGFDSLSQEKRLSAFKLISEKVYVDLGLAVVEKVEGDLCHVALDRAALNVT